MKSPSTSSGLQIQLPDEFSILRNKSMLIIHYYKWLERENEIPFCAYYEDVDLVSSTAQQTRLQFHWHEILFN